MQDPTGRYYNVFLGCIMGGAFGDAFGFPVEFMELSEIVSKYGPHGIVRPEVGPNGRIIISDDSQLTLFTMDGLTCGMRRAREHRTDAKAEVYLDRAYLDWYATQQPRLRYSHPFTSVYSDHRLRAQRAPGRTCMSALSQQFIRTGNPRDTFDIASRGTLEHPLNQSRGSGALMRSAPIGLMLHVENYNLQAESVAMVSAKAAAITHGHPFAWLSASLLSEIVSRITYRRAADPTLERLITNALYQVEQQFRGVKELPEFVALMEKALASAQNPAEKPGMALKSLGKGATGESVLAISIYLAIRYQNDYYSGIHAAVNQSGDSDTIGSVTGNILGAWLGYEFISCQLDQIYGVQGFLEQHLEMYDLLLEAVQRAWHTAILGE